MTAEILPFAKVEHMQKIRDLEKRLGDVEEALLKAHDVILSLQSEQKYRVFYQDLATQRLLSLIESRTEQTNERK